MDTFIKIYSFHLERGTNTAGNMEITKKKIPIPLPY